jgi:ribosome-associated toxin RatA of RatAB toxin-antitoxin module
MPFLDTVMPPQQRRFSIRRPPEGRIMSTVEDSILIAAPPEPLFALAQDYALRLEWDPFLREMKFLDGATEAAAGVRVWVRAWNGLTMEVEYVTVNPPHVVAMKMRRGPWFFESFAGSWRLERSADDRTRVTFRYAFTTRWRWLRGCVEPLIRWVFRRDLRARLRGLKDGAEQKGLLERLQLADTSRGAGC